MPTFTPDQCSFKAFTQSDDRVQLDITSLSLDQLHESFRKEFLATFLRQHYPHISTEKEYVIESNYTRFRGRIDLLMIVNEQAVSVHLPREEEEEEEGKEEGEGEKEEEGKKEVEGKKVGEDKKVGKDKKTEGEGQVKCMIAKTKRGTEEAGTQTRVEIHAMLANQIVGLLRTGEVVDSAVGYSLEVKKSGIRVHKGCAFFRRDAERMTLEISTLQSTSKSTAKALHSTILSLV